MEAPWKSLFVTHSTPITPVSTYKKRFPDASKGASSHAQLFNFGPSHLPGWLPPGPGDSTLPNLPAKSGMCMRLRCGKVWILQTQNLSQGSFQDVGNHYVWSS